MDSKRIINLVIGPVLMALAVLLLPTSVFTEVDAKVAIGTVAWMAYWWVTGPIDYAVTAFLPIAVNAVYHMTEMENIISQYASDTILLILGASILTVSWELTGLDKRIAAVFLKLVGDSVRMQVIFWFILSAVLSAILPNAVVCATITPIAVSMLTYTGEGDIANSKIGSKILLTIAYAAGLGGLATPLGGAMNLVVVKQIEELTGEEYMYTDWVIKFLPIMLVLLVINILFMIRNVKKTDKLVGAEKFFKEEFQKLPPMSLQEGLVLALFVIATLLSFTRQLYQTVLPELKPAYVFIIAAILSFLITDSKGERLMLWKNVQKKIVWELMYIFAGGLAVGKLIGDTGAAANIGTWVQNMGLKEGWVVVFVIVTFTLLMSDVTSNTATASVALPIVVAVIGGMGKDAMSTIPYIYIAAVGVNLSYMLPTSIRAIPVGYGLSPKYMLKEGVPITIIIIATMTVMCTLLLNIGFLG